MAFQPAVAIDCNTPVKCTSCEWRGEAGKAICNPDAIVECPLCGAACEYAPEPFRVAPGWDHRCLDAENYKEQEGESE